MTIFYNKSIQTQEINIPQISLRTVTPVVSSQPAMVLKKADSDSFNVTTQPLSATKEQIEGLVKSNPRLQRMFEEYNLWNYSH